MTLVQRIARIGSVAALVFILGAIAAPVLGANNAVSIVGKKFEPATITIAQGDTVTWTVTQSIGEPHSVTEGTPSEPDKLFDSGTDKLKENGQDYQHIFDAPGTYKYFCIVHPTEMQGEVVVLAAGQSAPANPAPAGPEEPAIGAEGGTPVERKVIAAGIIVATLVLGFAAAWFYRRTNPA
jgi:plastocyanin